MKFKDLTLEQFLEACCVDEQMITFYLQFKTTILKSNEVIKTRSFLNYFNRNELLTMLNEKALKSSNYEVWTANKNKALCVCLEMED